MELEIIRTYHPQGTNGALYAQGVLQCHTIELPWLDNRPQCSCIPEGRYRLKKRYSPKFREHLEVVDVPERELILIHPANNALIELRGCIAPVSMLTGAGRGTLSRVAFHWVLTLVEQALKHETVFLTLKSLTHDPTTKTAGAHAQVF